MVFYNSFAYLLILDFNQILCQEIISRYQTLSLLSQQPNSDSLGTLLTREQCDQIQEVPSFPKVAQKVATTVLPKNNAFQNSIKSQQLFWLFLQENLLRRTFKNHPIWSHCSGREYNVTFGIRSLKTIQSQLANLINILPALVFWDSRQSGRSKIRVMLGKCDQIG